MWFIERLQYKSYSLNFITKLMVARIGMLFGR